MDKNEVVIEHGLLAHSFAVEKVSSLPKHDTHAAAEGGQVATDELSRLCFAISLQYLSLTVSSLDMGTHSSSSTLRQKGTSVVKSTSTFFHQYACYIFLLH